MSSSEHLPKRIVSLQPSATAILAEIEKLDCLVACTKYCLDIYPELANSGRVIVADSWTAKCIEILAAKPDLVLAAVPYQENAVIEILKAGIRFLGCTPRTLADIYVDIASIAGIMGESERGQQVIESMKEDISSVKRRVEGATRPRVYCEEWGKPLIISQTWVAELVDAAGGESVGTPGAHTTAEAVMAENPDVIIAAWCGAGDRVPLEKVVASRDWQSMDAVKHGNVFCIPDEFLNTPAPTLIRGLHALASAIHPELFAAQPAVRRISGK